MVFYSIKHHSTQVSKLENDNMNMEENKWAIWQSASEKIVNSLVTCKSTYQLALEDINGNQVNSYDGKRKTKFKRTIRFVQQINRENPPKFISRIFFEITVCQQRLANRILQSSYL